MRALLAIVIVVVIVLAALLEFGLVNLSPEGEQMLQDAQESVGGAVEDAGQSIQGQ